MSANADDQALSSDIFNRSYTHGNPFFDFLTGFVPRKLKDLFRTQEWLLYNSTHIYAALNKLSDYSITDIEYQSGSAVAGSFRRGGAHQSAFQYAPR